MVYEGLPEYLHHTMAHFVIQKNIDKQVKAIEKAADDLAAYHYSSAEVNGGNREFSGACLLLQKRVDSHCQQCCS
ncbi:MAG: HD domain-containing protein [Litorilituus sp.]|nr:HD domain-containing protein [Litorilituus sp.]